MAETLSPNLALVQKQRAPVLSPASPFFLGSNDDKLERAQARAARAAAIRRKPVAFNNVADATSADPCLAQEQILELFQNCIKLASENKINQKNTWELNLIDHLCEIIKVEEENDTETNFQKASCTLEAGVKIYSMRVDSVHSEAYKVLGGINRVGQNSEQDGVEDNSTDREQGEGNSKKEQERKLSPLSTLEPSFEALNVKKFDVAFAVDPLYHQTSAQFDEGGAKGLLLNNLGVYGGCRVLFDSLEVPAKCMSCSEQHDKAETIDISYATDCIEQMMSNISKKDEISPSLKDIVNLFGEDNRRPPDTFSSAQNLVEPDYEPYDNNNFSGDENGNSGTWDFSNDNQPSLDEGGSYERQEEPFIPIHHEENEPYASHDANGDDTYLKVDSFLFLSMGLTAKQNAWAGPDHWKYRKVKGPEDPVKENGSPEFPKKPRNKKQAELDIEFTKALDDDTADVFAPPKILKSLLLPANREPCNTTLPEDCHYQPEDLVKLFLLPNVLCLGRRGRRCLDELGQEEGNGSFPSWDAECGIDEQFDDENAYSDIEDSSKLVSQPRQVNKIEVEYYKTSKQVDVQALKETLWLSMQETEISAEEGYLSFRHMLASLPANKRQAAASINDISPHLCFICILHLANEHGLSIHGCASLDDLKIRLPSHSDILQGAELQTH